MGDGFRESWLPSVRAFVLKEAGTRFPGLTGPEAYLVVKEPNGSVGAPLMMEALPESRMVLLVRDPRDAVASVADALREGGWLKQKRAKGEVAPGSPHTLERRLLAALANEDPAALVKVQAERHLRSMKKATQAYKALEGRKALIRYEDLRADPLGTLTDAYSTLEIPLKNRKLRQAVERHAWEHVPAEVKGPSQIHRKATPGGWREDLTPEQARIVEEVTRPLLEEFYP
jgi:Sulfotransferase domain